LASANVIKQPAAAPWALRDLPAFPPVATRLMQLLAHQEVEIRRLIELLRTDVALSSEILRRANSALYGLTSQVSSLQHAVLLLGFDQVRALGMAVAMGSYVKTALKLQPLRKCWRHSVACALVSEELAKASYLEHDRAYTAGLLHDIGLLGLMVNYPREYSNMLAVANDNCFDLRQTERDLFEVDHGVAGSWLAAQWKFPEEIAEAAEFHHETPAPGGFRLLGLVQWSCRIATAMGYEVVKPPEPLSYAEIHAQLPAPVQQRFPATIEEMRAKVDPRVKSLE